MKSKRSSDTDHQPKSKKPRLGNQEEASIVKTFSRPDYQSINTLANKLTGLLNMGATATLIRELNLFLKNKRLPDDLQEPLSRLITLAFTCLARQLNPANSDSDFSIWLSSQDPHTRGQVLAFLIYNSGQIAESGLAMPPMLADSLDVLLSRLANNTTPATSKAIANALYGLGLLAKTKKLDGILKLASLQTLLNRLANLRDLKSQEVSNSLYGLGLLAGAGNLHGIIKSSILQALLDRLTNLRDLKSQEASNSLYGLGLLAHVDKLDGVIKSSILEDLLDRLAKLPDLKSQNASNSLYGLGLLAGSGKLHGVIDGSILHDLLTRLDELSDLKSQNVSNSLYGLGLLAGSGKLHGVIKGSILQTLLYRLRKSLDLKSQDVSNSLYGLGLLAAARKLDWVIDGSILQDLLNSLNKSADLKSQDVSQSLYGLGLLAYAGKLDEAIDRSILEALLNRLIKSLDLKSQEASNSLYGLGLLAHAGKLNGVIERSILQDLLNNLAKLSDLKSQNASNSLYGLGLLANAGKLNRVIESSILHALLNRLIKSPDLKSQEAGNSLYGLGLLAGAGKLNGVIESSILQALLNKLIKSPDLKSQEASNSLYGLGLLANAGKLHGVIESLILQDLLNKLIKFSDLKSQETSNSLYGLGLLATIGKLNGVIDSSTLQTVLNRLTKLPDLNRQDASQSLYGLGLLAKASKLHGIMEGSTLQALFRQLLSFQDINCQDIANGFHGVGALALAGQFKGSFDIALIERGLVRLQAIHPLPIDARQSLFALARLSPYLTGPLSGKSQALIKALFVRALQVPYLHPSLAAELINAMIILQAYSDREMAPLLAETITALSLPLSSFPPRLQGQLTANLSALAPHPAWQEQLSRQLGLSQAPEMVISQAAPEAYPEKQARARTTLAHKEPTASTTGLFSAKVVSSSAQFTKACQNKVFNAIAKKNEQNLREILQLINKLMAASTGKANAKGATRTPRDGLPKKIAYNAEELVLNFFNETQAQALQELISQSQAKYFNMLLQACSGHARYQLAQSNALHPVIIHLPLAELTDFVKNLSSPFQIYRDHQALMHVLDAFTIRLAKSSEKDQDSLKKLQMALFKEGLAFHQQCKHHHVVDRLQSVKSALEQNHLALLDLANEGASVVTPPLAATTAVIVSEKSLTEAPNEYEYETEDIQAILVERVRAYPQVHVLAAAQMNRGIAGNGVGEVLADFIKKQSTALADGSERTLLLPIQDSGHWLGLMVTLKGQHIQRLDYFNSLAQGARDGQRMAAIQNQLLEKTLIARGMPVKTPPGVMLQCDGSSCGALLIENFYCHLKKQWWETKDNSTVSPEQTGLIRQRHLVLLKEHRFDYYTSFQPRQANNLASVPTMAIQLQSHGLFQADENQKKTTANQGPRSQRAPVEKATHDFSVRKTT